MGSVPTKTAEIRQGLVLPACPPGPHDRCSVHRRPDRVYEDQAWARVLALGAGHRSDGSCCR